MTKKTNRATKAHKQAVATPREIRIEFTLERESLTAKKFELAIAHYSGGASLGKEFSSAVAKLILKGWLNDRIDFPCLYLSDGAIPKTGMAAWKDQAARAGQGPETL
jgi:hypothetical protein